MQLLNALSFVLLLAPATSLVHKTESRDEQIALLKNDLEQQGKLIETFRSQRDSAFNIVLDYQEKLQMDIRELENMKHIIATSHSGKTDTVYVKKVVVDTAQLNKVKTENKRQIDSLKWKFDSAITSKKPSIGVRPNN